MLTQTVPTPNYVPDFSFHNKGTLSTEKDIRS